MACAREPAEAMSRSSFIPRILFILHHNVMQRNCIAVWTALVGLRLLIALNSSAIIHPDEHFQNPEITVATVFDYGDHNAQQLLRTWEWQGPAPCRSIVPAYISTGLAFQALKRFISGCRSHQMILSLNLAEYRVSTAQRPLGTSSSWHNDSRCGP